MPRFEKESRTEQFPMPSRVIDSNILIYHLAHDPRVTDALTEWMLGGERLFISAITRIEVLAAPTMQPEEELRIHLLLDRFLFVSVDARIADTAARIRCLYRLTLGGSIIAATALLTNSSLVTRNTRDFKKVSGLVLVSL